MPTHCQMKMMLPYCSKNHIKLYKNHKQVHSHSAIWAKSVDVSELFHKKLFSVSAIASQRLWFLLAQRVTLFLAEALCWDRSQLLRHYFSDRCINPGPKSTALIVTFPVSSFQRADTPYGCKTAPSIKEQPDLGGCKIPRALRLFPVKSNVKNVKLPCKMCNSGCQRSSSVGKCNLPYPNNPGWGGSIFTWINIRLQKPT